MEANAIAEDARAQIRSGNLRNEHVDEWWRDARHRWLDASVDLTTHIATHSVNPTYRDRENGFA
jgi:hypothetical protein